MSTKSSESQTIPNINLSRLRITPENNPIPSRAPKEDPPIYVPPTKEEILYNQQHLTKTEFENWLQAQAMQKRAAEEYNFNESFLGKVKQAAEHSSNLPNQYAVGQRLAGKAIPDRMVYVPDSEEELQNELAAAQRNIAKLGNALGQMAVIAGTTLVQNTLGTIPDLISSFKFGNTGWQGPFASWASRMQDATREALPIYKPSDYEDRTFWERAGSMEGFGEFLANTGFTLGMVTSSALMSMIPYVGPALAYISPILSAYSEGNIEALGAANEYKEAAWNMIEQGYQQDLASGMDPEEAYVKKMRAWTLAQEDARRQGNATAAVTYGVVAGSNYLQFGKWAKSFRGIQPKLAENVSKGVLNKERWGNFAKKIFGKEVDGQKFYTWSNFRKATGAVGKMTKMGIGEAIEEGTQTLAPEVASRYDKWNSFYYHGYNKDTREMANSLTKAVGSALGHFVENPQEIVDAMWQGFLGGFLGTPAPGIKQSGKRKGKLGLTWAGGIAEGMEVWKARTAANTIAEKLNADLEAARQAWGTEKVDTALAFRARDLLYSDLQDFAILQDDEQAFDDASLRLHLNQIIEYHRLGRLDLLKKSADEVEKLSDEQLAELVQVLSDQDQTGAFNYQGITTENIKEVLQKKANALKENIQKYEQTYVALKSAAPELSTNSVADAIYAQFMYDFYNGQLPTKLEERIPEFLKGIINDGFIPLDSVNLLTKGIKDQIDSINTELKSLTNELESNDSPEKQAQLAEEIAELTSTRAALDQIYDEFHRAGQEDYILTDKLKKDLQSIESLGDFVQLLQKKQKRKPKQQKQTDKEKTEEKQTEEKPESSTEEDVDSYTDKETHILDTLLSLTDPNDTMSKNPRSLGRQLEELNLLAAKRNNFANHLTSILKSPIESNKMWEKLSEDYLKDAQKSTRKTQLQKLVDILTSFKKQKISELTIFQQFNILRQQCLNWGITHKQIEEALKQIDSAETRTSLQLMLQMLGYMDYIQKTFPKALKEKQIDVQKQEESIDKFLVEVFRVYENAIAKHSTDNQNTLESIIETAHNTLQLRTNNTGIVKTDETELNKELMDILQSIKTNYFKESNIPAVSKIEVTDGSSKANDGDTLEQHSEDAIGHNGNLLKPKGSPTPEPEKSSKEEEKSSILIVDENPPENKNAEPILIEVDEEDSEGAPENTSSEEPRDRVEDFKKQAFFTYKNEEGETIRATAQKLDNGDYRFIFKHEDGGSWDYIAKAEFVKQKGLEGVISYLNDNAGFTTEVQKSTPEEYLGKSGVDEASKNIEELQIADDFSEEGMVNTPISNIDSNGKKIDKYDNLKHNRLFQILQDLGVFRNLNSQVFLSGDFKIKARRTGKRIVENNHTTEVIGLYIEKQSGNIKSTLCIGAISYKYLKNKIFKNKNLEEVTEAAWNETIDSFCQTFIGHITSYKLPHIEFNTSAEQSNQTPERTPTGKGLKVVVASREGAVVFNDDNTIANMDSITIINVEAIKQTFTSKEFTLQEFILVPIGKKGEKVLYYGIGVRENPTLTTPLLNTIKHDIEKLMKCSTDTERQEGLQEFTKKYKTPAKIAFDENSIAFTYSDKDLNTGSEKEKTIRFLKNEDSEKKTVISLEKDGTLQSQPSDAGQNYKGEDQFNEFIRNLWAESILKVVISTKHLDVKSFLQSVTVNVKGPDGSQNNTVNLNNIISYKYAVIKDASTSPPQEKSPGANSSTEELTNSQVNRIRNQIFDLGDTPGKKRKIVLKPGQTIDSVEQWDMEQELAELRRILPEEAVIKIVNTLEKVSDKKDSWGTFMNNIITLYNKAEVGTSYHEAFHYVINRAMSEKEQENFRNAIAKKYKVKRNEVSDTALEEIAAEEFRVYMISETNKRKLKGLRRFFAELKSLINYIANCRNECYKLYVKIHKGKYAGTKIENSDKLLDETTTNTPILTGAYAALTEEQRGRVEDKLISDAVFNSLSTVLKDHLLYC